MNDFLRFVLYQLQNSLWLVVLVILAGVGVTAAAFVIHKRKYKQKFPWGKALLYLVFAGYIAVVLYATILRYGGGYRDWNLHLFRAWREAWNNFSMKNWLNVLLNVAMFVPLGGLLPLLYKKCRRWYVTVPVGFAFSLTVELIQLATGKGICDVDDLFANSLGTVIGFAAVMLLLSSFGEKGKRLKPALAYCGLFLALLGGIGSIFVAYELKEYGNLPEASAYTNDISHTKWTLDCDLPESDSKMAVYQTRTLSTRECDAFAAEIAALAGIEVDITSYYQEFAYYNLYSEGSGSGTLMVYYHDGSYEYHRNYRMDDLQWTKTDRKSVEAALERFPVSIPEQAEFAAEGDGWYSFTVERYIDGTMMADGTLRCRYASDGEVYRLENHLLSYTYYGDAQIISAEEAYQRLCAGQFYDGGYFENKLPEEVSVYACTQGYEIDTKGFYQPVYYFEVVSADGSYRDRIMIPAIK